MPYAWESRRVVCVWVWERAGWWSEPLCAPHRSQRVVRIPSPCEDTGGPSTPTLCVYDEQRS